MRHTSNKVKRNRKTSDESAIGWDAMIRDAKKKIEDLHFSVEVFERRKASGDPWPGTQSTNQSSESATRC